ncbi:MAG: signal chemotaxis receptor [Bacillota bacterium]|nr:MAG: signal chemotaxis receptor [Bacillota bacterium]
MKQFSRKITAFIAFAVFCTSLLQLAVSDYAIRWSAGVLHLDVKEIVYMRQLVFFGGSTAVAVMLLVVLVLSTVAVRQATKPLEMLSSAFVSLRQGQYQRLPAIRSGDDIQALIAAYNETVSELEEVHNKLRTMADRDGLTGAYNRRSLDKALEALDFGLDSGEVNHVSFLFIDIDSFKGFNDTNGHLAGDEALRRITAILTRIVGDRSVFRYGGEEFAVVLRNYDLTQSLRIAEVLRREVEKAADVTISIGVALMPDHALSGEVLIARADKALYQAKETRNAVAAYQHG